MEGPASGGYRIEQYGADPTRIEVIIGRGASATFAYDPVTKEVIRTGLFVPPSTDISEEEYIGRGPLRNAAERARKHFESLQVVVQPEVPTKTQYELDLGDQTLH